METETFEQQPHQPCDFGAGGTSVQVEFIDNQVENSIGVGLQPLLCLLNHTSLASSHEHDAEHGKIRDEDVRWVVLHVPPGPHFSPIK
jgi:hypothetical protein